MPKSVFDLFFVHIVCFHQETALDFPLKIVIFLSFKFPEYFSLVFPNCLDFFRWILFS